MKKSQIKPEIEFVLQVSHYLNPNYKRINELLELDLDWNQVLGILNFHRIAGLAYYVLNDNKVNHQNLHRPIMFGLGVTYDAFYARAKAMNEYILKLNTELENRKMKYAFLKGSLLSNAVYPWGCRASSDIDILINASDIDNVNTVLREAGYTQGEYDFVSNKIIEFDRKELIFRRLNWGEVAMYHQVIDQPCAKKVSIDINFSLDWHPYKTKNIVEEFLNDTILYRNDASDTAIRSLNQEIFLLQLCIHAYKEINLYKSVQIMQDLELYKFIDIYTFIENNYVDWQGFIKTVKRFNFEKECYLVFKYIEELFFELENKDTLNLLLNEFDTHNHIYMNEVYDPTTNTKYKWSNSIIERIFDPNHFKTIELLQ